MFIVVKSTDDFPSDLIEAVNANRFHLELEDAKKMASGLKSFTHSDYEVLGFSFVWDTNQMFNSPKEIDTSDSICR